jgi:peroxiredoxin
MKENLMRWMKLVAVIAACMIWSSIDAGEFNQVLSIGDTAPAWKDLPGTDGKSHSLSDFKDKDAVVLVFTCVSCPYAVDYEDRFNSLAKQYGGPNGKVGFIGVCVNQVAADRLDKLTERANKRQFGYPVMYDESQKIAKDFGAIFTPEFYVLNKDRKIVYMGAFDDDNDASKVTKRFVEDAIVATLKGESPSVKETGGRGCMVRWAREKR